MAMPLRYQDIYTSLPLVDSDGIEHPSAAALMTVKHFQADAATMPHEAYTEHHVMLNLRDEPQQMQNWRDGVLHDYTILKNDIVVTPAGMKSGWRWFERSNVIVVTLDPMKVENFAERELGILLTDQQLLDRPRFSDADLVSSALLLTETLQRDDLGSAVMFEALSRVFLVKLLHKYGERREEVLNASARFTSAHYKRVLTYVRNNIDRTILVEDLASEVAMSASHFSRVFKDVVGRSPMQFVLSYRVEQADRMIRETDAPLGEIAFQCGFADQAHFSRSLKQFLGQTPKQRRARA